METWGETSVAEKRFLNAGNYGNRFSLRFIWEMEKENSAE